MKAAERILHYPKKNPRRDLLFTKTDNVDIEGHSDGDWAGLIDTRRSTTRYCISLGGNLVIWKSKRQTICVKPSTEV